jgi:hypothetical protein
MRDCRIRDGSGRGTRRPAIQTALGQVPGQVLDTRSASSKLYSRLWRKRIEPACCSLQAARQDRDRDPDDALVLGTPTGSQVNTYHFGGV